MPDSTLLSTYKTLNNSFKKNLVFHMGYEAGFFSEYNNMILAMLFCLKNHIKFSMYSSDANFGFKKGWEDYFESFSDVSDQFIFPIFHETNSSFQKKYNKRNHSELRLHYGWKDKVKIKLYKSFNQVDYLTQDIWLDFRDDKILDNYYNIPELGIDGDIRQACSVLVDLTWNFNKETQNEINKQINSLGLPPEYLGLHIRQGDKHTEDDLMGPIAYIKKAESLSNIREAFVSTDDYRVISYLKDKCPQWNIFTLCSENEQGYVHSDFMNRDVNYKKDHYLNFFSSVDILTRSQLFIGTFSSNLGMFMGMKFSDEKCYGIDRENWLIW